MAVDIKAGRKEKALCWKCASLLSQLPLKYPDAPLAMEKHLKNEDDVKKAREAKIAIKEAAKAAKQAAKQAAWEKRREERRTQLRN